MSDLLGENDAAAHAFLRDLVADPDFEFPDGHQAVWFGASDALRSSAVPGWSAAARARYARDHGRPGFSWDAGAWLYLVAAHGDGEDLAWVVAQYDLARERPGEAIAALGAAPPALARDALIREIRREPLREGVWDAITLLAERAPAEAFAVLHAMVTADSPRFPNSQSEVLRSWARTAPEVALDEVRARIHALAGAGQGVRALITPVQVLADRGQEVSEFADLIGSAGRELRRLVDEEGRADGTGPYYAIEYHRVAQTPENLAALEYAVQVLGPERAGGCSSILEKARARSEWK
ncbi:MAG TPA: hypothetical protein VFS92_11355 [Planctomycetota bacterium]|nr:hypothetical protein [Planctomycetota bacterium]